jgi:hypothetical protein
MNDTKKDNGYEEERKKLQEKRPKCSVDLQPMEQWVKEGSDFCRPCILPVTIDWYRQELTERGHLELVEEIDKARMSEDPDATCRAMDAIKDRVPIDLKYRLLEFDCSTQEHAAELEGEIIPPAEASQESSPSELHTEGSESETPQEPLPPEPPGTGQ